MSASEFGLWALAVFAWPFSAIGALFMWAWCKESVSQFWFEQQMRLRYLDWLDKQDEPFEQEAEDEQLY